MKPKQPARRSARLDVFVPGEIFETTEFARRRDKSRRRRELAKASRKRNRR
jgi:hypothetical protein